MNDEPRFYQQQSQTACELEKESKKKKQRPLIAFNVKCQQKR